MSGWARITRKLNECRGGCFDHCYHPAPKLKGEVSQPLIIFEPGMFEKGPSSCTMFIYKFPLLRPVVHISNDSDAANDDRIFTWTISFPDTWDSQHDPVEFFMKREKPGISAGEAWGERICWMICVRWTSTWFCVVGRTRCERVQPAMIVMQKPLLIHHR